MGKNLSPKFTPRASPGLGVNLTHNFSSRVQTHKSTLKWQQETGAILKMARKMKFKNLSPSIEIYKLKAKSSAVYVAERWGHTGTKELTLADNRFLRLLTMSCLPLLQDLGLYLYVLYVYIFGLHSLLDRRMKPLKSQGNWLRIGIGNTSGVERSGTSRQVAWATNFLITKIPQLIKLPLTLAIQGSLPRQLYLKCRYG